MLVIEYIIYTHIPVQLISVVSVSGIVGFGRYNLVYRELQHVIQIKL